MIEAIQKFVRNIISKITGKPLEETPKEDIVLEQNPKSLIQYGKDLEKKIAECEKLQKQLDMANLTIGELRGQIAYYNNQILEYKDRIASLQEENNGLYDAIEYEQKPWWKKIF